jgi:hypothetical protein
MRNLTSLQIGSYKWKELVFVFAFHHMIEMVLALPANEMQHVLAYIFLIIVTRR